MPDAEHGQLLLDHLARCFRHSDAATWRRRIAAGELSVNGAVADDGTRLSRGQVVHWRRPPWEEPHAPTSFAVLLREEHCLVVAKPSGLPTLPGGGFLQNTLQYRVRERFPEARPVHRLGRGTSGIVLFARTPVARTALTLALRDRRVVKIYRALVAGSPAADQLRIDAPIGTVPHPVLGALFAASPDGKQAVSHVQVLERRGPSSLVEVRIETGRAHQIRIHLAAAGHPLVGDPLYLAGGRPAPGTRVLPGASGYHLHASFLSFAHPVTSRTIEVACAPPPILRQPGE